MQEGPVIVFSFLQCSISELCISVLASFPQGLGPPLKYPLATIIVHAPTYYIENYTQVTSLEPVQSLYV